MRIGVTGGRSYTNRWKVREILGLLRVTEAVLVHGGASGADRVAKAWAEEQPDWELDPFPADWGRACDELCRHGGWRPRRGDGSTYCPAAGPIRNARMVNSGLDLLVAFPGGQGTEDMIRRARAAGILVLRVEE